MVYVKTVSWSSVLWDNLLARLRVDGHSRINGGRICYAPRNEETDLMFLWRDLTEHFAPGWNPALPKCRPAGAEHRSNSSFKILCSTFRDDIKSFLRRQDKTHPFVIRHSEFDIQSSETINWMSNSTCRMLNFELDIKSRANAFIKVLDW